MTLVGKVGTGAIAFILTVFLNHTSRLAMMEFSKTVRVLLLNPINNTQESELNKKDRGLPEPPPPPEEAPETPEFSAE